MDKEEKLFVGVLISLIVICCVLFVLLFLSCKTQECRTNAATSFVVGAAVGSLIGKK